MNDPERTDSRTVGFVLKACTWGQEALSTSSVDDGGPTGDREDRDPVTPEPSQVDPDEGAGTAGVETDGGRAGLAGLPAMAPSEQIMAAIEREGEWTWQSEIVDAVEISSSTVSRHLSSLEEEGNVDRVTIGRRKVVALPDAELDLLDTSIE